MRYGNPLFVVSPWSHRVGLVRALALATPLGTVLGCVTLATVPPGLPHAVSGERHTFSGGIGEPSYYVAGPGPASTPGAPPLLLIHSINAAGSAHEVRPLHECKSKGARACLATRNW